MPAVDIRAATDPLPDGLVALARLADAEDIAIVRTIMAQWASGEQRLQQPGEVLLLARSDDGAVVAVGGLTRCPIEPDALRVRRFYVHPNWRRQGIAGALARRLIADAFRSVELITCHAGASVAARPFWEAVGFQPVDRPRVTHVLRRTGG